MKEFISLNKRQIRELIRDIKINIEDHFFFKSENKIYVVSKGIKKIDLSKLNVKHIGLMLGEIRNNKLQLSKSALNFFKQ